MSTRGDKRTAELRRRCLQASWQCLREGEKVQSLYKKKKKCLSLSPVNQSLVILIYDATGPFVFFFGLKKKSIVSRPISRIGIAVLLFVRNLSNNFIYKICLRNKADCIQSTGKSTSMVAQLFGFRMSQQ